MRKFVEAGVRLKHIRQTAEALAREVGAFSFTRKPVLVGGRELLVRETEHILRRPVTLGSWSLISLSNLSSMWTSMYIANRLCDMIPTNTTDRSTLTRGSAVERQ